MITKEGEWGDARNDESRDLRPGSWGLQRRNIGPLKREINIVDDESSPRLCTSFAVFLPHFIIIIIRYIWMLNWLNLKIQFIVYTLIV